MAYKVFPHLLWPLINSGPKLRHFISIFGEGNCVNWGSEKLCDLLNWTQQVNGRIWSSPKVYLTSKPVFRHLSSFSVIQYWSFYLLAYSWWPEHCQVQAINQSDRTVSWNPLRWVMGMYLLPLWGAWNHSPWNIWISSVRKKSSHC